MKECVEKYLYQNARVFCITLSDAVKQSAELNGLSESDADLLGRLETFTCCIAALQKVDKASVTARLSLPDRGVYSAAADKDGIVRGRKEETEATENANLEVTLHLSLRGNYTGVVTGSDFDSLVCAYFTESLQIASSCRILHDGDGYFCLLAEKLPGETCDLSEICALACETLPKGIVPEDFEFLESSDLRFGCTCSRGALLRLVSAMSEEDRRDLAENGKIVTSCNACGKKYTFEI